MSRKYNETQKRILTAAWSLLESAPEKGVRMSDIAKEAGVSRQAVYLHFPKRVELLKATTRFVDQQKDIDERLAPSRSAPNGVARLDAYVEAWGNYIPEIYGVVHAILSMADTDAEARDTWEDRMHALREGCQAVIGMLSAENRLTGDLSHEQAADLFLTLISVQNWEHLVRQCGWSQDMYIQHITALSKAALIKA
ncbi:MAG: TetR/AcrR family transcriptional regulator [Sneathiella sp.]|nr:TetR/AcrR family transcriptional regulator [Sneathiella sp.]